MNRPSRSRAAPVLGVAAVLMLAACAAAPGAPATGAAAPETRGTVPAADTGPRLHAESDVRFIQHMLGHHAQALVMTALVPTRSTRNDLVLLAERIDVSQRDEIAMMQRWLQARGESVPSMDAHGGHDAHMAAMPTMPGMLTPAELARLAAASGPAFDRLFLESMIHHHEGALVMVAELFASPGGAQQAELFSLASDIESDQRTEIARMRRLLETMPPSP